MSKPRHFLTIPAFVKSLTVIGVLPLALALSGCGPTVHYVGSAELASARQAVESYEEYLLTYEPLYFALAPDGKTYYYTFCTENCLRNFAIPKIPLDQCNIYATWTAGWSAKDAKGHPNECKLFAIGEVVVWTGPVRGPMARYIED